jgi:Circadian oscillating protein COP23
MPGSMNMKATTLTKITVISICVASLLGQVSIVSAQPTQPAPQTPTSAPGSMPNQPTGLPKVTDSQPPQVVPSSTPDTSQSSPTPDANSTATASNIKIKCEELNTVVQKGDRQASMFNWNSKHFGSEFTPEKRCQIVSTRLQAAADRNGGTLKGLQLESGLLNGQTVICISQTGEKNCTDRNLLFTLKPENAKNPQAVIAKIATFAESGGSGINESTGGQSQVDLDLGNWEGKAFPKSQQSPTFKSRKAPTRSQNNDKGF